MKKHQGMSLVGLIVVAFLVLMGVLLVFKLIPPYTEYFTIQKTFKNIANNPDFSNATPAAIQSAFWRYADVNYITVIKGDDIKVTKIGTQALLSASYTVKVPLFANISLLLDFNPTSDAQWYDLKARF
jgi:hypothetical protein